jgi:tRNA G18 (ribose-2'-O)-methylase SpoU
MPRPHKPSIYEIELQRKIDGLSTKLLQVNAALRLKVIYCQRLETLVCQRNQRVDQLYSLLERARRQNILLDEENERLATMIANDHRPQAHIGEVEAP